MKVNKHNYHAFNQEKENQSNNKKVELNTSIIHVYKLTNRKAIVKIN